MKFFNLCKTKKEVISIQFQSGAETAPQKIDFTTVPDVVDWAAETASYDRTTQGDAPPATDWASQEAGTGW